MCGQLGSCLGHGSETKLSGFVSLTGSSRRLRQTVISCTCDSSSAAHPACRDDADPITAMVSSPFVEILFPWQAIVLQSRILRERDTLLFFWPYLALFDSRMVQAT